jgi:hypothetical protein
MKKYQITILTIFFITISFAQSSMPKRSDFCSPSEFAGALPDDLVSWCQNPEDDYYSACDCEYEKALKAWKKQQEEESRARLKNSGQTSNSNTGNTSSTTQNKGGRVFIDDSKTTTTSNSTSENDKETDVDYSSYRRNRLSPAEQQMQAMNQFSNDLRQAGNQLSGLIAQSISNSFERKERERLNKLEEKRIENERIEREKRIDEEKQIAEDKKINELKKMPEYLNFLEKVLIDAFYLDDSGKDTDMENATYEMVYLKQDNGFYVAKYFNIKESYLEFDISYEIIPNPFIESLKTGSSIKYGPLNTKDEIVYYYRNKLKQRTLNLWWRKKMHFEFYNYKDEKVFATGEISSPETMTVSSKGAITRMEYKIPMKRGKFKTYSLTFDGQDNVKSLMITNEKNRIEESYNFSKY